MEVGGSNGHAGCIGWADVDLANLRKWVVAGTVTVTMDANGATVAFLDMRLIAKKITKGCEVPMVGVAGFGNEHSLGGSGDWIERQLIAEGYCCAGAIDDTTIVRRSPVVR